MAALRYTTAKTFFALVFSYAEILSLDICIGVIGSGALAASLLNASMRPVWWFVLPAAVWVVYTAEHLFDARKTGPEVVHGRHRFHREHFLILTILAVLIGVGCVIAALFYLPDVALTGSLLLCLPVTLHLFLVFWGKIRIGKEVSAAVIYSLGVWLGPYLRRGSAISWIQLVGFLLFILAALLNLFMNSIMDYETEKREKVKSARGIFSLNSKRGFVIAASWLASLGILVFLKYGIKHRVDFIILAGFCFLLILCAVPGFIVSEDALSKNNNSYRRLSEWIFSLGILLTFLPR